MQFFYISRNARIPAMLPIHALTFNDERTTVSRSPIYDKPRYKEEWEE